MELSRWNGHVEQTGNDRFVKLVPVWLTVLVVDWDREAGSELLKARDILNEDAKGIIANHVQWKHFVCESGSLEDVTLLDEWIGLVNN